MGLVPGATDDGVSRPGKRATLEDTWLFRVPVRFLAVALLGRLVAVGLSIPRINPYAQADAISFATVARGIATGEVSVSIPTRVIGLGPVSVTAPGIPPTKEAFGLLLSPFWHFPGPSLLYARLTIACVGVLATYNVYLIAKSWHSHRGGVYASLPYLFFSSILLAHGALLRESFVLFGLTLAARAVCAPSPRLSATGRALVVAFGLGLASFLRPANLPVYLVLVVFGFAYASAQRVGKEGVFWAGGSIGVVASLAMFRDRYSAIFSKLTVWRGKRSVGTTAYLADFDPNSVWKAIAFAPIGAAYFYLAPFPWMVESPLELFLLPESILNLLFMAAAVAGARMVYRRQPTIAATLVVGFLAFSFLYGIVEGNVGAAIRHRQMFTWVVYTMGGVALADRVRITV